MKFESVKDHVLSSQEIGARRIYVVSERQLIRGLGEKRQAFGVGAQITPIYIVVLERGRNYAFSLETGQAVGVDAILLRIPSLKEEILSGEKTEVRRVEKKQNEQITFDDEDYESPF